MALHIHDRYVWVACGIGLYFASHAIRSAMTDVAQLIQLDPAELETEEPTELLEDAISLDTLRTLVSSPNPSVAAAATSLVVARFIRQPQARGILGGDCLSGDPRTRFLGRQAAAFLRDYRLPPDVPQFNPPVAWQGDDAEAFLPPVGGTAPRPRPPPRFATAAEQEAVHPRDRWAPFGSRAVDPPDPGPPPEASVWRPFRSTAAVTTTTVPSVENPVAGWTNVPRERPAAGGADEREEAVRRMRREAMVVWDGDGLVVDGEDIIRPRG